MTKASSLKPVTGGFHHRMWHLRCDTGDYAVKQLGEDVYLEDPAVATHVNACEVVAAAFAARDVPALAALDLDGQHLQVQIEFIGLQREFRKQSVLFDHKVGDQ